MTIVTRAEWGARAPRSASHGALHAESTCHWNGPTITVGGQTIWDHSKCAGLVRGTQNFHMDSRGWSDIAYNFLVCQHGIIFEGRGLDIVNAANGTNIGNHTSHTIMCLAGPGNPFDDVEKAGFLEAVAYIHQALSVVPMTCKGHRDWHSTECPGDVRYAWVHGGMDVPVGIQPTVTPVVHPVPQPPPSSGAFGDWPSRANKPLLLMGSTGDAVTYVQKVISSKAGGNITVDGKFGPQTQARVEDVQRVFKLAADGKVGPNTWGAIDFIALH